MSDLEHMAIERIKVANDVFNWWMEYDILPGQIDMEDFLVEDNDE